MAKLIFTLSSSDALDFPLDASLTRMGRKPDNDIVINNSWISGYHAEFRREAGRLIVKDLGSSNGTAVNGEPINEKELQDGDRISFGQLDAIYQADALESTPEAAPVKSQPPTPSHAPQNLRPGVTVVPRPHAVRPMPTPATATPLIIAPVAKSGVPATPPPASVPPPTQAATSVPETPATVVIARPMAPPPATIAYDQARKEMSAELEEIQQKTVKANTAASTARTAMEEAQAELARVRKELEEAKTQFATWQATEENTRSKAADEAEAAAAARAKREAEAESAARTVLSGLEEAIAQKRQEQAALESSANQRSAALAEEARIAAAGVTADLDAAKAALASVTTEVTGARETLEKIREETGAASSLLDACQAGAAAAAETLKQLQQESTQTRQDFEILQARRESAQTDLTRTEEDLTKAKTALEIIRQETASQQEKTTSAQAAAQAELDRLKREGAEIIARHSALESAIQQFSAEAAAWPARREAAAAELAEIQASIRTARESASVEDRRMADRIKATEELERQHNVIASKLADWQEKEAAAKRHSAIIETFQKEMAEATARHESIKRELDELTIRRTGLTEEIKALESRMESLRRDIDGAEALNSKVTDLRHQQAEAERRLDFLNDRLSGMSEAPDPNWGTVHSLARSFIKKLDLIDDLIKHLDGHPESAETLTQLQVFRSGLQDILKEYSIESYSLEPGTVIDVAARKRIQIVETLSEGSHDGTLIVRTYRPGYVCQNGDLGIPTLLRKADVAVSIAMS